MATFVLSTSNSSGGSEALGNFLRNCVILGRLSGLEHLSRFRSRSFKGDLNNWTKQPILLMDEIRSRRRPETMVETIVRWHLTRNHHSRAS